MAKKAPTKPLFDIKADYEASLARVLAEAGMLADAARMLLSMEVVKGAMAEAIKERLDAFDKARFGDDAP